MGNFVSFVILCMCFEYMIGMWVGEHYAVPLTNQLRHATQLKVKCSIGANHFS